MKKSKKSFGNITAPVINKDAKSIEKLVKNGNEIYKGNENIYYDGVYKLKDERYLIYDNNENEKIWTKINKLLNGKHLLICFFSARCHACTYQHSGKQ